MASKNRQDVSDAPVIVHLGSKLEVRFGYLDPNGNVIPQEPFVLNISALTDDTYDEIRNKIEIRREKLVEMIAQSLSKRNSSD